MFGIEADEKKFVDAMGDDGMKKLSELEAACVVSREDDVFLMNAKMSYPSDAMVQADPGFWRPKAESKAAAPAKAPTQ